jgi:hypothetical protein
MSMNSQLLIGVGIGAAISLTCFAISCALIVWLLRSLNPQTVQRMLADPPAGGDLIDLDAQRLARRPQKTARRRRPSGTTDAG